MAGADLTAAECQKIRLAFKNAVWVLNMVDIYWVPRDRRIAARSVMAGLHIPLPHGCLFVGRYGHPSVTPDEFLEDLLLALEAG